jgi:ribosomal protein L14
MSAIQTRTEIIIKDNSGLLKGRVINCKANATVGSKLKLAITKTKSKDQASKKKLQDVLIIQTKKPLIRLDGSTVSFSNNSAVTINLTRFKLVLGFKRIPSCVPFEVKCSKSDFKGGANIIKLARALV